MPGQGRGTTVARADSPLVVGTEAGRAGARAVLRGGASRSWESPHWPARLGQKLEAKGRRSVMHLTLRSGNAGLARVSTLTKDESGVAGDGGWCAGAFPACRHER